MTELLAPMPKDRSKANRVMICTLRGIARRAAAAALVNRPNSDVLLEVYCAGLIHGQRYGPDVTANTQTASRTQKEQDHDR